MEFKETRSESGGRFGLNEFVSISLCLHQF
jgi:hypothetical protein